MNYKETFKLYCPGNKGEELYIKLCKKYSDLQISYVQVDECLELSLSSYLPMDVDEIIKEACFIRDTIVGEMIGSILKKYINHYEIYSDFEVRIPLVEDGHVYVFAYTNEDNFEVCSLFALLQKDGLGIHYDEFETLIAENDTNIEMFYEGSDLADMIVDSLADKDFMVLEKMFNIISEDFNGELSNKE